MDPSYYQSLKLIVIDLLWLTRDAIHIHIGFLALMLTLIFTQLKLYQWKVLILPFSASLVMEILDLMDDLNHLGKIHLVAYLHDILNTNLIPFLLVCWAKRERRIKTESL